MSRCLSLPLKHPVIFNAHRSYTVKDEAKETLVLPLFISKSSDYRTITHAVELMEANLRNILRTLERLKER